MMKLLDIASYSFLISDTDYNKVNQTFRSFLSFLILETDNLGHRLLGGEPVASYLSLSWRAQIIRR